MWSAVPAPKPGELWPSYVMRVRAAEGSAGRYDSAAEWQLMLNAGWIAPSQVILGHTNFAYARLVSKVHAGRPAHRHSDAFTNPVLFTLGTKPSVIRCCPRCHEEDLSTDGISYWRRIDQLPGIVVCQKHGTPLMELPRSCMTRLDLITRPMPEVAPTSNWEECATHPVVQRFARLSVLALSSRASIDPSQMSVRLTRRATALGLRVTDHGKKVLLSDWARDQLPAAWVTANFSGVDSHGRGKAVATIDGVFKDRRATYRTSSYLLAMAMLWDDPDEAFTVCTEIGDSVAEARHRAAGIQAIASVSDGMSIRAACRLAGARFIDFERALRARLSDRPANQVSRYPATQPYVSAEEEPTAWLLAELEGR